jgi:hypothetical protein
MRLEHRWVIVILLCTLTGVAQQPATDKNSDVPTDKPAATGTVTGRVFLNDTKGPARKATVSLQSVTALLADAPPDHGQGQADGEVSIAMETNFDGSFSFSHVAAGSYYVIASYPGYISPYLALSLAEGRSVYGDWQPLGQSQKAAKELVLKTMPRIEVQASQPVSVDVSLERGAAVSGNVSYDDGSAAAGLEVNLLARLLQNGKETWAQLKPAPNFRFEVKTDDRGNYRITGLPSRKYIVQVTLDLMRTITYTSAHSTSTSSRGGSNALTIYSGSTPRLKDAASFTTLAEECTGEDIRIPLSKLHTITGNIVSAHDGHVINAGQIYLYRTDDHSFAGAVNLSEDSPEFTFNFIYEGEYLLTSPMSADVDYDLMPQQPGSSPSPPQYDSHPRHLYGSASKPLHVDGDMDGVTIAVPEPTAKEAQVFKDALQREEQQNQSPTPSSATPQ